MANGRNDDVVISIQFQTDANRLSSDLQAALQASERTALSAGQNIARALAFDNSAALSRIREFDTLMRALGDTAETTARRVEKELTAGFSNIERSAIRSLDNIGARMDALIAKAQNVASAVSAAKRGETAVAAAAQTAATSQAISAASQIQNVSKTTSNVPLTADLNNIKLNTEYTRQFTEQVKLLGETMLASSPKMQELVNKWNLMGATIQGLGASYQSFGKAFEITSGSVINRSRQMADEQERYNRQLQANLEAAQRYEQQSRFRSQTATGYTPANLEQYGMTQAQRAAAQGIQYVRDTPVSPFSLPTGSLKDPSITFLERAGDLAGKFKARFSDSIDGVKSKVNDFTNTFSNVSAAAEASAKKSSDFFNTYFSANFFAGLAVRAVEGLFDTIPRLISDTVLYAARTEELGIALNAVAKANDIATDSMTQQEDAIKRLNITTQDARQTISRFVAAELDLSKSGALARVAQDLAVISGLSTSEELNKLIIAIQTLQSRNLRSAGVFLTVDEVLDRLSATTGRARDSFSTLEKQQAVLNAVLEYGSRVAGTYEAAMTTASKQIRSLERVVAEAQNAIGERFTGALLVGVEAVTYLVQAMTKFPGTVLGIISAATALGAALVVLNTSIVSGLAGGLVTVATAAGDVVKSMLGMQTSTQVQSQLNIQLAQSEVALAESRLTAARATLAEAESAQAVTLAKAEESAANAQLTASQARLAQTMGTASLNNFAAWVGRIAIIGAVVAAIYTGLTALQEAMNAPRELKSLDLNLAKRNQEDLNKLVKAQQELTVTYNSEASNTVNVRQRELEVSRMLTKEQSYQFNLETQTQEQRQKNLGLVQAQIDVLKNSIQSQKSIAAANVEAAFANYDMAKKEQERLAALFAAAKQAREQVGPNENWSYYRRASESLRFNDISKKGNTIVGPDGKIYDATSDAQVRLDPHTLAAQYDTILKAVGENAKELEKFDAQVKNTVEDIQKLAASYGTTPEDIINAFYGPNQQAQASAMKARLDEVRQAALAAKSALAISEADLSEGGIGRIAEGYYQRMSDLRRQVDQDLRNRKALLEAGTDSQKTEAAGLTEDEIKRRTEEALARARTGFIGSQEFKETEKSLNLFIADELRKRFEGRSFTQEDVTQARKEILDDARTKTFTVNIREANGQLRQAEVSGKEFLDTLSQAETYDKINNYLERAKNDIKTVGDELNEAKKKVNEFFAASPEERKQRFEIEDYQNLLRDLEKIGRLQHQLGRDVSISEGLKNNPELVRQTIKELEREVRVQEEIRKLQDAQKDAEAELTIARAAAVSPVVNAETRAHTLILKQIRERRDAEQQLTADIIAEIDKRTREAVDSAENIARIQAEAYLGNLRDTRQAQEDLLKEFAKQALSDNPNAFNNNSYVQAGLQGQEGLDKLVGTGNAQLDAANKTNDLITTNVVPAQNEVRDAVKVTNDKVDTSTQTNLAVGNAMITRLDAMGTNIINIATYQNKIESHLSSIRDNVGNIYEYGVPTRYADNASGGYDSDTGGTAPSTTAAPTTSTTYVPVVTKADRGTIAQTDPAANQRAREQRDAMRRSQSNIDPVIISTSTVNVDSNTATVQPPKAQAPARPAESDIERRVRDLTGKSSGQLSGPEAQAALTVARELSDEEAKQNEYMIKYRENQANALIAQRERLAKSKEDLEVQQIELFQESDARTKMGALYRELSRLRTKDSETQRKIANDVRIERLENERNLEVELQRMNEERRFRSENNDEYRRQLRIRDFNERTKQAQDLEDEITILQEREKSGYYNTITFRTQLDREYQRDRLRRTEETLRNLYTLERQAADAQIDMLDELRKHQAELNLQRAQQTTEWLKQQQDAEDKIAQQGQINNEQIRASVLANIASQKSLSESIADLFNDSFNQVAGGFDGLIDKMTKKLGGFGTVIGNFLKSFAHRAIGSVFNSILDSVFPRNSILDAAQNTGIGAGVGIDILNPDDRKLPPYEQTEPARNIKILSQASADAAGSVTELSNAANAAAGALYNIPTGTGDDGIFGSLSDAVDTFSDKSEEVFSEHAVKQQRLGAVTDVVSSKLIGLGSTAGGAAQGLATIVRGFGGIIGGLLKAIGGIFTGKGFGGFRSLLGGGSAGGNTFPIPGTLSFPGLGPGGTAPFNPSAGTGLTVPIGASTLAGFNPSTILHESVGGIAGAASTGGFFSTQLGGQLALSLPMLGASLGGMLGGQSVPGSILGAGGGLALGALGAAFALQGTALAGSLGLTGIIGSLTAAAPFIAPIAAVALIGAFLIGRNKRRREEEKLRAQVQSDAISQLQEILRKVRGDKMDGDEAITQAMAIRQSYLDAANQMKDKKTRNHHLQDVRNLDLVIDQIKAAAAQQARRKEIDDKLIPTYAEGGIVSDPTLIRVSRGETLFYPTKYGINAHRIPGSFDARDDIYAVVPRGTVIMNPRQVQASRNYVPPVTVRGYAGGGVAGTVSDVAAAPASGTASVTPPPVVVVVVADENMARTIVEQTPNAVIAGKTITHVQQTGTAGLAGVIGEALSGGY